MHKHRDKSLCGALELFFEHFLFSNFKGPFPKVNRYSRNWTVGRSENIWVGGEKQVFIGLLKAKVLLLFLPKSLGGNYLPSPPRTPVSDGPEKYLTNEVFAVKHKFVGFMIVGLKPLQTKD